MKLDVLIVDDDEVAGYALAAAVEAVAGVPRMAATLAEARTLIASSLPDVLLLDLSLPDGDGIELLAEIAGTACQIICVSAHQDEQSSIDAVRKGAAAYLTKPVDLHRLWTLLGEIDAARPPD